MIQKCIALLVCCFLAGGSRAQSADRQSDSLKSAGLFSVIRSGETEKLDELLNKGLSANDSIDRYSLLMVAAMSGTLEEMKTLIAHGARVNYRNRDSLTALWLAIPDWDKTNLLIDHGADVNAVAAGGMTPVMKLAIIPGSAPLIRLFMAKGVNIGANNPNNILIAHALVSADTSNLSILLDQGLDVNAPDRKGSPPIVDASNYYCYPTLKMLVEHGANMNACDKRFRYTPLMNAAAVGDERTILYLLGKGADTKMLDFEGYTALTWLGLADMDRPDIAETFCRSLGELAFKRGNDGTDGLYWIERKGNTQTLQVIMKYKQQQK